MRTRNSSSCAFVVGIPSSEPCVSLDRFFYHPVSPASFPLMMTRSSSSCTSVVGIPSTGPCVSLDRFSYHPVLSAFLPTMMTGNSPSCTFVVGIPSSEPCVSLDPFSYHHVFYTADVLLSYGDLQVSKLYFCGRNFIYWAPCLPGLVLLPPCIAGLFSSYDEVVLTWSEFYLLGLMSH